MKLEDQIALLNPQPGEHLSANYKRGSEDMRSVVLEPHLIPDYVDKLPLDADIWIGVNPVDITKVNPGGRGTSRDTTRLTALFADLDVKEGGCDSYGKAMEIIFGLADILGEEPTMIVHSGHGMQPYWVIEPGEEWANPRLSALLTRWGGLVRIVAKSLGAQVDSVFDMARILRAVGTLNNKRLHLDGFAVEVTADLQTGGPMTLAQVEERLDEYGVPSVQAGSEDDFMGESDPATWRFTVTTCPYVHAAVEAWRSDPPGAGGRHPWMHGNAIRLSAFHRNGCLTADRHTQARAALRGRFEQMCVGGIGGPAREFRSKEFSDSMRDAAKYVGMMSDSRLVREVNHLHGVDNAGGPTAPSPSSSGPAQGHSAPFAAVPDGEADDHRPTPDDLHRRIFEAEDDFWCATDGLKQIYETSMARMVAPWSVLAYCVARVLQLVPSSVQLPGLVGKHGSLNWFSIVVDKSGGGKSAAASVAEELVYPMFPSTIYEAGVGSGEGMIGQFFTPDPNDKKIIVRREAVMFTADEIDNLTAMSQRQGGTTLPMIRTAFSGGTLGHSYITKGRDIHVTAHTYRMTLVVNAQPSRCGSLLDDANGGTPQRFMWFPANDRRPTAATADENFTPPGISLPGGMAIMGTKRVQIPVEARAAIIGNREKGLHGDGDALDGHAMFAREKLAYALALLDGRTDMGSEDWRLSGIAAEVSSRCRDWVVSELADSLEVEARQQGRIKGISFAAARESESSENMKRARRVQDWVLAKLKDKGPLTVGSLRRLARSGDRPWIDGAVGALSADGLIVLDADGKQWAAT